MDTGMDTHTNHSRMKAIRPALLLLALMSSGLAWAEEGSIVVNLKNIRDDSGMLRASLYREAETFRKEDKALQVIAVPSVKGAARLVFNGVPPGRYAIMAYHDENADGKLNLRLGMFPKEGYGLSNNPAIFGPPKFADSAFEHAGPATPVDINISY